MREKALVKRIMKQLRAAGAKGLRPRPGANDRLGRGRAGFTERPNSPSDGSKPCPLIRVLFALPGAAACLGEGERFI